jgi:hypothetical protein
MAIESIANPRHCPKAPDGRHVVARTSIEARDDQPEDLSAFIIAFCCALCGRTGETWLCGDEMELAVDAAEAAGRLEWDNFTWPGQSPETHETREQRQARTGRRAASSPTEILAEIQAWVAENKTPPGKKPGRATKVQRKAKTRRSR